ncbi:MAG: hypothetical protein ACF8NJ_09040 [Phycisphaerales bacterium JB038]
MLAGQTTDAKAQQAGAGEYALAALANVVVFSAMGALRAHRRGDESVRRAAAISAAGAGAHFAGKALVSDEDPAVRWLARYTAVFAASVTRSGMEGIPIFSCVSVPVAIVWLNSSGCERPAVTFDAATIVGAILAAPDGDLDVAESVRSGALVFRAPRAIRPSRFGWTLGSTVTYQEMEMERQSLRHELLHVLQHDMLQLTVGRPVESWLADLVGEPWRGRLAHLDLGVYALIGGALSVTPVDPLVPLEREARILDRVRR